MRQPWRQAHWCVSSTALFDIGEAHVLSICLNIQLTFFGAQVEVLTFNLCAINGAAMLRSLSAVSENGGGVVCPLLSDLRITYRGVNVERDVELLLLQTFRRQLPRLLELRLSVARRGRNIDEATGGAMKLTISAELIGDEEWFRQHVAQLKIIPAR